MKILHLLKLSKSALVGIFALVFAFILAWLILLHASWQTLNKYSTNQEITDNESFDLVKKINKQDKSNSLYPLGSRSDVVSTTRDMRKESRDEKNLNSQDQVLKISARSTDKSPDPLASIEIDLEPRKPHPPTPLRMPPGKKIRLSVKFMDNVMARSNGDNHLTLSEASSEEIDDLVTLSRKHGLVFQPAFDKTNEVDVLRIKAARRSRKIQADLNGTMTVDILQPEDTIVIAKALQLMNLIESVDIESLDQPPPPPSDIAPTTPDLEPLQGHLSNNPGFGVNYLKALGADGSGIRYSDCEYGYNATHEDLVDANLTDNSRAVIYSEVYTNGWDDHGTAAVGITMAQDNNYGVTGIAPNCEGYFHSEWTTLGYSRTNSVSDAVLNSRAGDVILLEMQTSGDGGYVPAEYDSTIWNLCNSATDAGIIVVAAAGNGNQNLDDAVYQAYMNRGDSGAIIIGAGSSNSTHSKQSYSTYGSRVDIQAWGGSVMTTGYGSYAKYGDDENQAYIAGFSGTSSASACVAGAVVLLQSYAKNKLNTLFTPEEMRAHLKTYSHQQGGSGGNIGSAIALDLAVAKLPSRSMDIILSNTNDEDVSLSFWGLPFRNYKIEFSQELNQWDDLITNIPGSKNQINRVLIDELKNYSQRFYRLREE